MQKGDEREDRCDTFFELLSRAETQGTVDDFLDAVRSMRGVAHCIAGLAHGDN